MSVQRKHIDTNGTLLIPVFSDKSLMLDYFGENKSEIEAEKMSAFKTADAFGIRQQGSGMFSTKATVINPDELNEIQVKVVINATNLMDSHKDVHMKGIWKKSLSENPPRFHLQEHKMTFENEISKEFKAYTEITTFKNLGYSKYKGDTEVLMFDSKVKKSINEYMFRKYALGQVDNHSVGMQYMKMIFCVNSDSREWATEKDGWDKYFPEVVNQKDAENSGYFWAVLEAKAIEGSAVLGGSCWTTPTMSVQSTKDNQPSNDTDQTNTGAVNEHSKKLTFI